MITRRLAVDVLNSLIESSILTEEVENMLSDIQRCINAEESCWHLWGADEDDVTKLHTAYRSDLLTPEFLDELKKIEEKYTFIPAPYEAYDEGDNSYQTNE